MQGQIVAWALLGPTNPKQKALVGHFALGMHKNYPYYPIQSGLGIQGKTIIFARFRARGKCVGHLLYGSATNKKRNINIHIPKNRAGEVRGQQKSLCEVPLPGKNMSAKHVLGAGRGIPPRNVLVTHAQSFGRWLAKLSL